MKKLLVILLKKLEWGSALACRLTQLTGKAPLPTHPKHLVDFGQLFYLPWLESHDRILDLGCHQGEHSFKVAAKVKQVVGLDVNPSFIALAKQAAQRQGLTNVTFRVHNLERSLPYASHSFNKVFFFAVLEHLRRRDQILGEIRRVLKPNGMLFMSIPNKNSAWKKLQRSVGLTGFSDPDHKIEFSKTDINILLKQHHFKHIKIQTTALDTPISGLIDLIGGVSLTLYQKLMHWKLNQGKKQPDNSVGFLISAHA